MILIWTFEHEIGKLDDGIKKEFYCRFVGYLLGILETLDSPEISHEARAVLFITKISQERHLGLICGKCTINEAKIDESVSAIIKEHQSIRSVINRAITDAEFYATTKLEKVFERDDFYCIYRNTVTESYFLSVDTKKKKFGTVSIITSPEEIQEFKANGELDNIADQVRKYPSKFNMIRYSIHKETILERKI